MKPSILVPVFLLTLVLTAIGYRQSAISGRPNSQSSWTLAWSDEFNGPDGSLPDARKWSFETGGNGWGNQELEYYTRRPDNVHIEDGHLVIIAPC